MCDISQRRIVSILFSVWVDTKFTHDSKLYFYIICLSRSRSPQGHSSSAVLNLWCKGTGVPIPMGIENVNEEQYEC